jgi:hypothetical protein
MALDTVLPEMKGHARDALSAAALAEILGALTLAAREEVASPKEIL